MGQILREALNKKKIWNFPDLVGGWVWKSPLSRVKRKYALKVIKMSKYSFKSNFMVAPWPHKDKKLISLTISTDPSYIWSTDSKTELR